VHAEAADGKLPRTAASSAGARAAAWVAASETLRWWVA
jgi:hypothetical protein